MLPGNHHGAVVQQQSRPSGRAGFCCHAALPPRPSLLLSLRKPTTRRQSGGLIPRSVRVDSRTVRPAGTEEAPPAQQQPPRAPAPSRVVSDRLRQEDEDHSANQITLLLGLSVTLLSLPWLKTHPVGLLVPLLMLALPLPGAALRPAVGEAFSMLAGGVRWLLAHPAGGRGGQQQQQQQAQQQQQQQQAQQSAQPLAPQGQPAGAWQRPSYASTTHAPTMAKNIDEQQGQAAGGQGQPAGAWQRQSHASTTHAPAMANNIDEPQGQAAGGQPAGAWQRQSYASTTHAPAMSSIDGSPRLYTAYTSGPRSPPGAPQSSGVPSEAWAYGMGEAGHYVSVHPLDKDVLDTDWEECEGEERARRGAGPLHAAMASHQHQQPAHGPASPLPPRGATGGGSREVQHTEHPQSRGASDWAPRSSRWRS